MNDMLAAVEDIRRQFFSGPPQQVYMDVELPLQPHGDRWMLTDAQLSEDPALAKFIGYYPAAFERDDVLCGWIFRPNDDLTMTPLDRV